jgi:hypothetical protein
MVARWQQIHYNQLTIKPLFLNSLKIQLSFKIKYLTDILKINRGVTQIIHDKGNH